MLAELRDIATIVKVSQTIPAQVLLSKPVVLLDARGRCAPFHLEFIDSAEVCAYVWMVKIDIHRHNAFTAGLYSSAQSSLQGHRPAQDRERSIRPRRYNAEEKPQSFGLLEHNCQTWTAHIHEYDIPISWVSNHKLSKMWTQK